MMNNLMFSSGETTTGAIYTDPPGTTTNTGTTYADNTGWYLLSATDSTGWCLLSSCPPKENNPGGNKFIKEGIEMKGLYDVYLVYGEDRKDIVLERAEGIIANDEEDAKIKSGLMKKVQDNWDSDYLTFIVRELGKVFVKEKPKEVKNI